jgi:hypothetical protein
MREIFTDVMRWFVSLNMHEWTYVLVGAVAFGLLCMRGYGSRHNY